MGYAHYWHILHGANALNYEMALSDISTLIEHQDILANGLGKKGTRPETNGEIAFNGIGDDSHETCYFPASLDGLDYDTDGLYYSDSCKTNRKPYDTFVVAALCILKMHMTDDIRIRSDGKLEDIEDGQTLAIETMRRCGRPIFIDTHSWWNN